MLKTLLWCQVDKIYLSTPSKIAILDHEKKRTFVLRKDGLPDAGMFVSSLLFLFILAFFHGARGVYKEVTPFGNICILFLVSGMESLGKEGQIYGRLWR